MDTVLRGLEFCFCYIDDILIASRSEEEHKNHLKQIFTKLKQYGLTINIDKCVFFQKEIRYLGCTISAQGTKPCSDRVDAILRCQRPQTVEQLRRFLGIINYYRRFLPVAVQTQASLYELASENKKKDKSSITWDDASVLAFERCKRQLADATQSSSRKHTILIKNGCIQ